MSDIDSSTYPIITTPAGAFYFLGYDAGADDPANRITDASLRALFQSEANTAGKAPQRDADGVVSVSGVRFYTSGAPSTPQQGDVWWDAAAVALQYAVSSTETVTIGQEMTPRYRNSTGSTLANMTAVYIAGSTGTNINIAKAKADALATAQPMIGLVTDAAGIANGSSGRVCVFGLVNDVDTSAFSAGDTLYLSAATAGGITNAKPSTAGQFVVRVGFVQRAHATQGSILVAPHYHGSVTGDAVMNATSAEAARSALGAAEDDLGNTAAQDELNKVTSRAALSGAQRKLMSIATGTTAQLRVLSFGDSIGYYKAQFALPEMVAAYGKAGQIGHNTITLSGGAALATQDFTLWPTGENWTLPSGGTITFSYGASGSILSDRVILFYLVEPGAGSFKVQTSLAGASFVDEAGYTSVSAAGTQAIGVITLSKTAGAYRAQVVGLSGTVKFFRPCFRHTTKSGIEWYRMDYQGTTLTQMNTMPSGLFSTVLTALSPDLIMFEMREVSDDAQVAAFPAQLAAMQARFDAVVPNASWVFSGAPPMQDATQDARTIVTNRYLREHALANERYYFDGYVPLKNWANVNALGWGNDGVHLADPAQKFLAEKMRKDSGLGENASLGVFGAQFGADPSAGTITAAYTGSAPAIELRKFAGSLQAWPVRLLCPSANNRGLQIQAAALAYEGAETYSTGLEVAPLDAYLGSGNSGVIIGGGSNSGTARVQMPSTGTSALANGISWGSGNTMYYHASNDALVIAGMDFQMASSTQSLVLVSPNSTRYRLTVSDAGVLSTTAL